MGEKERLAQIMEKEQLTAKEFAERVGVSAATISNIMQGRNNPSLEVVQKVLNSFRAIASDWMLFGSGPMYREQGKEPHPTLFDERPLDSLPGVGMSPSGYPLTASTPRNAGQEVRIVERAVAKKIQNIMIFYEDGTYQEIEVS